MQRRVMNDRLLRTYLNDHLAGAEAGLQLAEDCLAHNPTGPLAAFLPELVAEIEEDRDVLKDLYGRLHSRENVLKKSMTWLFSKMSRLKLEHALLQYSDLTRLEELEGLLLGVRGKRALWESLEAAADERFSDIDFHRLQQRAEHQLARLEAHHHEAARHTFAP